MREKKDKRKRVGQVVLGGYSYQVEIEPDAESGGYVAEVAGLEGCITDGDTIEDILANVPDAISTYLEAVDDLAKRGMRLPITRRRVKRAAGH
jgi:predicted RNase H-like HicB family nuclease